MNGCCNICGNAGFAEAIVTCSKCRTSREHLYCMRVLHTEQPSEWYCQDCEPGKETMLPTRGTREDLAMTSTFKSTCMVKNDTRQFADARSSNKDMNKVPFKWERRVQKGRTKYISVAEALKLPSGSKKSDQALINTSVRPSLVFPKTTGKFASPVKNMHSIQPVSGHKHTADTRSQVRVEVEHKKTFSTPPPSIGCGSKAKSVIQPRDHLADVGYRKSAEGKGEQTMKKASIIPNRLTGFVPRVEVVLNEALSTPSLSTDSASIISGNSEAQANKDKQIQNTQLGNFLSEVADTKTTESKVELVMKKVSPRPDTSTVGARRVNFGGDVYTSIQHKSSEAEKDNLENLQPNQENYRVPAQDASWKGSFKMLSAECNKGFCSGIQGCPPSRVLKKVYEMSKRMPEVLQFELIPRSNMWKDIFQDRCPDFDDVGLFFFPSEHKRCNNYFTWIEFIGKNDMAMRTCMWGVELLVFTSAHLHNSCQTWNGVHFFWGLFRVERVKMSMANNRNILGPCPTNEAWNCSTEGDDGRVVDMEIDMEAGVAVGVVDIVKKRGSLEDKHGAVREPVITTTTYVASAPLALSGIKEEPHDDSIPGTKTMYKQRVASPLLQANTPRLGTKRSFSSNDNIRCSSEKKASLPIDARAIATTHKELGAGVPPGFEELQTSKTTVAYTPPHFEELQTSKTAIDAREIAMTNKELGTRVPPGFEELQTSKTTVVSTTPHFEELQTSKTAIASNIPPGFEKVHALRTSVEPSKSETFSRSPNSSSASNLSPQTTNCARGIMHQEG